MQNLYEYEVYYTFQYQSTIYSKISKNKKQNKIRKIKNILGKIKV